MLIQFNLSNPAFHAQDQEHRDPKYHSRTSKVQLILARMMEQGHQLYLLHQEHKRIRMEMSEKTAGMMELGFHPHLHHKDKHKHIKMEISETGGMVEPEHQRHLLQAQDKQKISMEISRKT